MKRRNFLKSILGGVAALAGVKAVASESDDVYRTAAEVEWLNAWSRSRHPLFNGGIGVYEGVQWSPRHRNLMAAQHELNKRASLMLNRLAAQW